MVEESSVDPKFVKEIEKRENDHHKEHSSSSSSSSDSEIDTHSIVHSARKDRLFGCQKPLHLVLGGGKSADVMMWRNKQASACVFSAATVFWLLFECVGYHLLTFLCHSLILTLATLFLWSNLASFANMSPTEFPKITVPESLLVNILLWLREELNKAIITFRVIASGKDLKKFLSVIAVLWVISVIGSWFSFFTLFYLVFVMLLTLPMLYEKHEDHVDTYAEKAWVEIKKQYAVLDEKVIQKLPVLTSQKVHKQD